MKTIRMSLFTLFLMFCLHAFSQAKDRNLLTSRYDKAFLADVLDEGSDWVPYPPYSDRKAWGALSDDLRSAYIQEGEKQLHRKWVSVSATAYLEFLRSGNRRLQEGLLADITGPMKDLFLAEMVEGKGRFLDSLIDGIWALCESSFWGSTAHLYLQKNGRGLPNVKEPPIDLGASNNAQFLSWIHYFLHEEFDKINPLISERIEYELQRRILEPFHSRDDFWWMGLAAGRKVNNWNPYCNGNLLPVLMLMEKDRRKRIDGIYKIMTSLDQFTNGYGDDGGCDEGPSYWGMAGASQFECLDFLKTITRGRVDIFDHPLIKNMARYIYWVDICYPYFINFADASARVQPNPYLVWKYGDRIHDPLMKGFGAFLAQKQEFGTRRFSGTAYVVLQSLFFGGEISATDPIEPLPGDFWLPDLQVMGARSRPGNCQAFFLAAKGGHNDESHNHNDIGTFVLYYDGAPVFIDAGVGTYTAQTFSNKRYELWTMQSAFHNTPAINGIQQSPGKDFRAEQVAYEAKSDQVTFALDLAAAYPQEAAVEQWRRTYQFFRNPKSEKFGLEIRDQYRLKSLGPQPTYLSLMTLPAPLIQEAGRILLAVGPERKLVLEYDPQQWTAVVERLEMTDSRLQQIWGDSLYRILLQQKGPSLKNDSILTIRPAP